MERGTPPRTGAGLEVFFGTGAPVSPGALRDGGLGYGVKSTSGLKCPRK